MTTPIAYRLSRVPGAGMAMISFTAASDADAETVAQIISSTLGTGLHLFRTDAAAPIFSCNPAAQPGALGNSVANVLWSPL